jgi:hypothetical protein
MNDFLDPIIIDILSLDLRQTDEALVHSCVKASSALLSLDNNLIG